MAAVLLAAAILAAAFLLAPLLVEAGTSGTDIFTLAITSPVLYAREGGA